MKALLERIPRYALLRSLPLVLFHFRKRRCRPYLSRKLRTRILTLRYRCQYFWNTASSKSGLISRICRLSSLTLSILWWSSFAMAQSRSHQILSRGLFLAFSLRGEGIWNGFGLVCCGFAAGRSWSPISVLSGPFWARLTEEGVLTNVGSNRFERGLRCAKCVVLLANLRGFSSDAAEDWLCVPTQLSILRFCLSCCWLSNKTRCVEYGDEAILCW